MRVCVCVTDTQHEYITIRSRCSLAPARADAGVHPPASLCSYLPLLHERCSVAVSGLAAVSTTSDRWAVGTAQRYLGRLRTYSGWLTVLAGWMSVGG